MVIIDRQDYISKANNLLSQNTYKTIQRDPTNTIKNKLITILKRVKSQTGISNQTYKAMYPTGCVPPQVLWSSQDPQARYSTKAYCIQLWICYLWGAKELTKILKPLVGKSPHHINSAQDFVEQVKHITLVPGEYLSSYDVSVLFTSVPIDPALKIIKDLLVKDPTLKDRTVIGIEKIILLLEFCLKNTYFSFQVQFFEQVEGVLRAKSPKPCTPPGSGTGMWMTPLLSTWKPINKASLNT